VTVIESSAFANCINLQKIIFEGVEEDSDMTIKTEAFLNCSGLRDIHLPENLVVIEAYAFSGAASLSTVYINAKRDSVRYAADAFATKNSFSYNYFVRIIYICAYVPEINFTEVFGISNLEKINVDPASQYYHAD